MRAVFLASSGIVLALFGVRCSPGDGQRGPQEDRGANRPAGSPTSGSAQSSAGDANGGTDLRVEPELMQAASTRESAKLGLDDLRESATVAGIEIRVLVGLGLTYPRCFVLKNRDGKRTALYVAPKVVGDRVVFDKKGQVIIARTELGEPESGWDGFDRFLTEHGIGPAVKLAPDEKHVSGPDGEIIIVESKSGATYSMAFFSLWTESEDGQKALQVCRRIEQDFKIVMGCGTGPAHAK